MKKLPAIAIALIIAAAHTATSAGPRPPYQPEYEQSDSTAADTTINIRTQHLDTLVVSGKKKELPVMDAIRQSMNSGLTTPRQKSVSDIIGSKANDYILNPFGFKKRHDDKMRKKTEKNLSIMRQESYEDELTRAIMRQLLEDSLGVANKK